ncbi:sigma-70 family RNA polymerase sigma factor [Sphingomonas sp. S1-29]|uniref:sigma-70 family RNA polymerase sigma factor n=1 Tax=Sphingomonas sp. S1-29 TaxID=2991074 RepID=UPI00223F58E9|nr:sigma-70 family RNA polymerase sigma factor [Sphingomonas sp. S1-29]UZK70657.1 sigma-70 family RNA polymerase sigma factor [Sphingomonas sp. S1-29]
MTDADSARALLCDDIARVAAGDRAALKAVYDRTSAKLFGVCFRIVKDRESAEDVLQEVYLKVWHRAARFDRERASPITWLCAIARNSAIDWRRTSERRLEDPDELIQTAFADVASTDENMVDHEGRMLLAQCLDTLEEHQHHSIRAAFFDGYTYAELAERASVPLGTMKSWVRRGLERLKRCIDHG